MLKVSFTLEKVRMAFPTKGSGGMKDVISEVFGKTKTFTILDIEKEQVTKIKILNNPVNSFSYGSGPIAVKTLVDYEVNLVIAVQLGSGVLGLLKQHNNRESAN
jgi:predicted Fe-Mo cluster-binding NifX family protein